MANEYTGTGSTTTNTTDDGLKSKAQEILGKVQDTAGDRIESKVSDGKSKVAGTLDSVASTLLTSSQTLREQGQGDASRYIEKAADQVDRLATYLERADVHEVFDQVEGFARRQPAAFMASAFAVGFLASRFLKSSRGDIGYTPRNFSDTGRSYGTGSTGSSGISRGYDAATPRTENWRTSGYSASESSTTRDVVGDPSARTSSGLETNIPRSGNQDQGF